MYNASHSYVKISVFTDLMWVRDAEQNRACAEQGDARNCIKNYCFTTLIFKLVNPLKSLEDISLYMNRFLRALLVCLFFPLLWSSTVWPRSFPRGGFFLGLLCHELIVVPMSRFCRHYTAIIWKDDISICIELSASYICRYCLRSNSNITH